MSDIDLKEQSIRRFLQDLNDDQWTYFMKEVSEEESRRQFFRWRPDFLKMRSSINQPQRVE